MLCHLCQIFADKNPVGGAGTDLCTKYENIHHNLGGESIPADEVEGRSVEGVVC